MNNEVNNNVNTNVENTNNVPTSTIPVTNPQEKFVMQQPQIIQSNTVQMPQVNPTPVVQTPQTTESVLTQVPNNDPNAMINENLKKVEIKNYTPPSKFKIFLLIVFFILLVLFVLFLPEVTELVEKYTKKDEGYQKEDVITTGTLLCTMNTNTTNLDKEYEFSFNFKDSKLTKTKFITTTRGDVTADSQELDGLADSCKKLKTETKEIEGVEIRCDYEDGRLIETQSIYLETVDLEKLDAAYTEAGGMLPGYEYLQDIDGIEKNMKVAGYSCQREK